MHRLVDDQRDRIEAALEAAVGSAVGDGCPPLLAQAMRHAVFAGGARVRPRLCLAVSQACGDGAPGLADAVAASIELLHCASLVHDDLPCMDDAPLRRGRPSVHRAFGQAAAVLAGDALIALAFSTQAAAAARLGLAWRGVKLTGVLARSIGAPSGLAAGQAWELEAEVSLTRYHRAKTAALFEAATVGGALAAGRDEGGWAELGQALGEAYQVADDLADALGDMASLGKPVGRDVAKGRPSAARALGVDGARRLLGDQIERAAAASRASGASRLEGWLRAELGPIAAMTRTA
jgi:geranylgeranyl diphosphate synthase type II